MTVKNLLRLSFVSLCLLFCHVVCADSLNMPRGVTPISHDIFDLHMFAMYICIGIGVVVFGGLIYSLVKFRHSKGGKAATFHEHLGLEILWTVVPFIILVALAIPSVQVLYKIHDTRKADLVVKVVGHQWYWSYDYLDYNVNFKSNMSTPQGEIEGAEPKGRWFLLEVDHPMVVPINKKVRILVTSNDVIHSWWIPDLGVKQDAIPGYVNENWFYVEKPGEYRGMCSELCGAFHGFMPIVVKAVPQKEFDAWLKKKRKKA